MSCVNDLCTKFEWLILKKAISQPQLRKIVELQRQQFTWNFEWNTQNEMPIYSIAGRIYKCDKQNHRQIHLHHTT